MTFACNISWGRYDNCSLSELLGKTLISVKYHERVEEVHFIDTEGNIYVLFHQQDCCENVYLQDVEGSLSDLVGSPITMAEEVSSDLPPLDPSDAEWGSYTWTFYKFATVKGYVDLRWYGLSNGYYSESVNFIKLKEKTVREYDPTQQGDTDDDI
jgi:hypothetical protein